MNVTGFDDSSITSSLNLPMNSFLGISVEFEHSPPMSAPVHADVGVVRLSSERW
jgi:hypothetical protein